MKNQHKGSTFDSFLQEEGLLENTKAIAIKRVLAYEFQQTMEKEHLNKKTLASKMHTSRSAVDRVFDPENTSITLNTLVKAAAALGKTLTISVAN